MSNFNSKTMIWSAPAQVSIFNPKCSLGEILFHGLNETPEHPSEYHEEAGVFLKCADLRIKCIRMAAKIKKMNLKAGDVLMFACRNIPELTSIICGSIIAGIVVNPVSPDYQTDNFKSIIEKCKPKLIFCHKYNKIFIKDALEELCHISEIINVDNESSVRNLFDSLLYDLDEGNFIPPSIENAENTTALILTTAGTTGPPKCVPLSHSIVISQLLRTISIKHDDTVLLPASMHLFSGISTLLISIANRATRVISDRPFDAQIQLKLIEKYKITKIFISPAHLSALVDSDDFKRTDISSIKLIQTGGEALMKTLKREVEDELLDGHVIQSYGLIEIGGTATLNHPIAKEYSVGQPVFENKFKIINEFGQQLGPREEGEICIKPPYPPLEYCSDEILTKKVIDHEGFIHTGDIGYFDADNYLFIVGRCQEIIQYTGFQI